METLTKEKIIDIVNQYINDEQKLIFVKDYPCKSPINTFCQENNLTLLNLSFYAQNIPYELRNDPKYNIWIALNNETNKKCILVKRGYYGAIKVMDSKLTKGTLIKIKDTFVDRAFKHREMMRWFKLLNSTNTDSLKNKIMIDDVTDSYQIYLYILNDIKFDYKRPYLEYWADKYVISKNQLTISQLVKNLHYTTTSGVVHAIKELANYKWLTKEKLPSYFDDIITKLKSNCESALEIINN